MFREPVGCPRRPTRVRLARWAIPPGVVLALVFGTAAAHPAPRTPTTVRFREYGLSFRAASLAGAALRRDVELQLGRRLPEPGFIARPVHAHGHRRR